MTQVTIYSFCLEAFAHPYKFKYKEAFKEGSDKFPVKPLPENKITHPREGTSVHLKKSHFFLVFLSQLRSLQDSSQFWFY